MASPALVLDLDGTLVDNVYQHVLAWHEGLQEVGLYLPLWRIHRRVGMGGSLFLEALGRDIGRDLDPAVLERIQEVHRTAYRRRFGEIRPLPGARELIARLSPRDARYAIATSGRLVSARPALDLLELPDGVPVVTRDQVRHAKPDPDLFLEAARQLKVDATDTVVVGDSVWDMLAARRARALGVGMLSGGYGAAELERAGAYRVYQDPADLLQRLHEVGVR